MLSLSSDLYPEILRHLTRREDLKAWSLVNSDFNSWAQPELFSHVDVGGFSWPSWSAKFFLGKTGVAKCTHIKSLTIGGWTFAEADIPLLSSLFSSAKHLQSVTIDADWCHGSWRSAAVLWDIAVDEKMMNLLVSTPTISNITHLSLHKLRHVPLTRLSAMWPRVHTLRVIDCTAVVNFSANVQHEPFFPHLEHLTMDLGALGGDRAIPELVNLLESTTSNDISFIRSLNLPPPSDSQSMIGLTTLCQGLTSAYVTRVTASLQHLSFGDCLGKYIVETRNHGNPSDNPLKPPIPLSSLPRLQTLTIDIPCPSGIVTGQSDPWDLFFKWLCLHFTNPKDLPPSFAEVIFLHANFLAIIL
ncbi:hypothetical protein DL96DRAFT_1712692 [Flagelloscypha sp. PMI_526]|nr:hypothetical protein DL96DRAFT_1712692 [Flagelloscypha sp. PMI_526]